MKTATKNWFSVDRKGLADIMERRGKERCVIELVSNAFDEKITRVEVELNSLPQRGRAKLVVTDDSPDGWKDLTHAYVLFAPSLKKGNAEQRGRFNLGEKLLLAMADEARVVSTTGGIRFDETGRHSIRERRAFGSRIEATIKLNREEVASALKLLSSLIVPAGVAFTVNGAVVPHREPAFDFYESLETELDDGSGVLKRVYRSTKVKAYPVREGEKAQIFELGIPVVEMDCYWNLDIQQKVVLNLERDNVPPSYLNYVRSGALREGFRLLPASQATAAWVKSAIETGHVGNEGVAHITRLRFGDKVVAFDPSDQEANHIAASKGYTVVSGGTLSGGEWSAVKAAGAMPPAGQVTPSSKVLVSPDGIPPIPYEDWTETMRKVANYARSLAKALLDAEVNVAYWKTLHQSNNAQASMAYSPGSLSISTKIFGPMQMGDPVDPEKLDAMLIHEFGHHMADSHFSSEYHEALCKLGAKMRRCYVYL